MTESIPPQKSILLLGRSLFMAAIEAGLRGEPGVVVRRLDDWSLRLRNEEFCPDAVLVDSIAAHADTLAAIVAAHPEVLVVELATSEHNHRQAVVRYGELRTLTSAHELAELIANGAARRSHP